MYVGMLITLIFLLQPDRRPRSSLVFLKAIERSWLPIIRALQPIRSGLPIIRALQPIRTSQLACSAHNPEEWSPWFPHKLKSSDGAKRVAHSEKKKNSNEAMVHFHWSHEISAAIKWSKLQWPGAMNIITLHGQFSAPYINFNSFIHSFECWIRFRLTCFPPVDAVPRGAIIDSSWDERRQ